MKMTSQAKGLSLSIDEKSLPLPSGADAFRRRARSLMDLNGQFWKSEGQTFSQRFCHWIDILDPLLLFASNAEIENARARLLASRENITESLQDKKIKKAWNLSLASVHPGTGDTIPVAFRPPVLMLAMICSECEGNVSQGCKNVFTTLLPHRRASQAVMWQFIFYTYIAGFSLANGNYKKEANQNAPEKIKELPQKQLLISTGAVLYSACFGAFPHYLMTRFKPQNPSVQLFLKQIILGPLTAFLSAFSLMVIRSTEFEDGIEVMDSKGEVIGVSRKAGEKAVKETALSRAAMFGAAICVPDCTVHCLKRTSFLLRNPFVLNPLRYIVMVFVLGAMIPVSFSWMPQIGKIKRSELEPEVVSSTEETEFFYNRGV